MKIESRRSPTHQDGREERGSQRRGPVRPREAEPHPFGLAVRNNVAMRAREAARPAEAAPHQATHSASTDATYHKHSPTKLRKPKSLWVAINVRHAGADLCPRASHLRHILPGEVDACDAAPYIDCKESRRGGTYHAVGGSEDRAD